MMHRYLTLWNYLLLMFMAAVLAAVVHESKAAARMRVWQETNNSITYTGKHFMVHVTRLKDETRRHMELRAKQVAEKLRPAARAVNDELRMAYGADIHVMVYFANGQYNAEVRYFRKRDTPDEMERLVGDLYSYDQDVLMTMVCGLPWEQILKTPGHDTYAER